MAVRRVVGVAARRALQQTRYASLRDSVNAKKLREAAALEDEVKQLNLDIEGLDQAVNKGSAKVDRVEEVVEAMTEEEIQENKEIIKRMMVRGLRAFAVVIVGIAMVVLAYRRKRIEMEEKRKAADEGGDVSKTLLQFQKAFEDAVEEVVVEEEEEGDAKSK